MSKNVKEDQSPFAIPSNVQLFGFYQWNEAKRRNKKEKKSCKSVTNYVKKYPVIKDKETSIVAPLAITDIDPGYFTDLAGRPIREKFSRRKYVEQVNKVLKTKLLAGYNKDHCIRIDQQFDQENNKFNDIEDRYREYSSAFEKYLSNDHEASMKVLEEADQEARNSSKMISKRDRLLKEFGQVRLEVYQWREMWRDAKMCHEFIRKIFASPEFNATVAAAGSLYKEDDKSMHSEGESIVYEEPAAKSSLECLVETFEKEISDSNLGPGGIAVENPLELSRIFSEIESRNLDALIHLESLAKPMEEMTTDVVKTEKGIKKKIRVIEENIQELESLIEACEQRAANLKAYADYLLQQVFRELVCSESVLYLQVFIEDTYESSVGPNHGKLDAFTMMRTIEKTYESLNMTLDNLPKDIVKQCEKEGFTQEMKMMREAEDAAQKFNLMHRLLAALERIMEPPELNIKTKSKDKDDDKSSKHKSLVSTPLASSRASIIARQKNLQLKQLIMAKRSPEFLSGNDKSVDQEIKDLTFEIKKLAKDYLPADKTPSAEERHDCRDEIL